uniref:response regulator n=1 Tax=Ningiella ruwaisensis TaxID=2364274 RepID=UPI00109F51FF|nr:response regulator [Ningiella ruwaisensis]
MELEKYQRRIERERIARKEAERLLEEKAAELYEKNLELFALSESLEKLVADRTAQMQKARDDALAALKVKTDFIANMSHELRTPLNGVLGVLMLLQNESLNEQQHELLDVAESSGRHLLEVINDILDFTKIEANKVQIEMAPIDIRPFFKNAIAPFILQAKQKGIQLSFHCAKEVDACLLSDKLRLTQILTNLLSNALKFTTEGEVSVSFHKSGENMYQLAVADSGIGISQKNLQAVFSAFEQADTSITREFGGTGLGMNITKRLVDMLGGSIDIESQLGVGTTFYVDIPMKAGEKAGEKAAKALSTDVAGVSGKTQANAATLMLVEDHKVNQMIAKKLLESWGFTIILAENGKQALELLGTLEVDAVLMDLQMPIMGGIEASKRIRKEGLIPSSTPIIAMTAHSTRAHIDECLQAGMQAHISKPLDKDILYQVLQRQLDAKFNEQQNKIPVAASLPDIEIAYVNLKDSLLRVNGDWPTLFTLLSRFLTEFNDIKAQLSHAEQNNDIDAAKAILHKLKGSGGNLGLNSLSALAGKCENALLEGTWPDEQSIEQLEHILHGALESLYQQQDPNHAKTQLPKVQVDAAQVLQQIEQIQSSLKQDIFAAEDAFKTLLTYAFDDEIGELLNQAEFAMQAFDIERVSLALAKIKQRVKTTC